MPPDRQHQSFSQTERLGHSEISCRRGDPDRIGKRPLTCQSIMASIRVKGQDLPNYEEIEDIDNHVVECYIPSRDGETFEIQVVRSSQSPAPRTALQIEVFIDGAENAIVVYVLDQDQDTCIIKNIQISPNLQRKLRFQKLQTTADDSYLNVTGSPDLGSIYIRVFRRHVVERRGMTYTDYTILDNSHLLRNQIVHETSFKAGGLNTGLGAPIPTQTKEEYYATIPYSTEDVKPIARFYFKYRTLASTSRRDDDSDAEGRTDLEARIRSIAAKRAMATKKILHQTTLLARAESNLKQAKRVRLGGHTLREPMPRSPEV
ncbi:hypothetical protein FRC02_004796 [Tulasnella sp. 418]|nr:hypothetical protein FRC02_004796 [Tulasnella sp. 418]